MYKKFTYCLMISSLLFCATDSFAKELKNLTLVKETYIKYHDSGEYQKDQTKVTDQAMLYLKNMLASEQKKHSNKKLALVLDIDETSLSNYTDLLSLDFGGTKEQRSEVGDKDTAIQPTLELFRYAKANHVAVFFITGRKEHSRNITIKNLMATGYNNWDGLILKPENYNERSVMPYKTSARDDIEKQGYVIILNVGDQESDLAGGHARKTFKLPNPYYFIP